MTKNINTVPWPPFKRSGTTITQRTSGDDINSTGHIFLPDDKQLQLGNALGSADSSISWNTAQTVDTTFVGLKDANNTLVVAEEGDKAFDFAHGAVADPHFFMHSHNQSTNQWVSMHHDGIDGNIEVGTGSLNLPAGVTLSGVALKTTANIDWYIATTGSDITGDGTIGNPWLTRQHAYDLLPDVIAHKCTIHLAAGTYYDGAILRGHFVSTDGSIIIQGATTTILASQTASGGSAIDANGYGQVTKAGAGWGVDAYKGYFVKFITSTGPATKIYVKYAPIISNTADTLFTPPLRFASTAATTFDIVQLDTTISGASAAAPNLSDHNAEKVTNMQAASSAPDDGLYARYAITYDALTFQNNISPYDVYVTEAWVMLSGCRFTSSDPTASANYWCVYAYSSNNYVWIQGCWLDGYKHALYISQEAAILNAECVYLDYRNPTKDFTAATWTDATNTLTKVGAFAGLSLHGTFPLYISSGTNMVVGSYTATYVDDDSVTLVGGAGSADSADVAFQLGSVAFDDVAQTATGGSAYLRSMVILGNATHVLTKIVNADGNGSYADLASGRVEYATSLFRAGNSGFVSSFSNNSIHGTNNTNLYTITSTGAGRIRPQTDAGYTTDYNVDDTSILWGLGTAYLSPDTAVQDYAVKGLIHPQTVVVTSTIPLGFSTDILTAAGPITLTSTPTIQAGVYNGQPMTLIGTSDVNTITLQDASLLPGTTLELLNDLTITLGLGDKIDFKWNTATSKWEESGNTFMNMLFKGVTGQKNIYLNDNQADALSFAETTNKYLTFKTTNGAEEIQLLKNTTAITQTPLDNSTKLATTAYVEAAVLIENLWDRTGTVLSPYNAGDTMAAIGDISSANNATTWNYNIPVTGADAGAHTFNLQIDGNTFLSSVATGDGAGGVGINTISLGVSGNADIIHIGDANAVVDITDAHWNITETGVLSIVSFGADWTNAGRTVADLGIITTVDINGGTIDATSIGASIASTIIGTTIQANTGFMPDADDGAYLGQSGTAFSDLFLASGAVINFNAGDVLITHADNQLSFGGALLHNINQASGTTGLPVALTIVGGIHTGLTALTEDIGVNLNFSATKTWASGVGTLATQREIVIQAPTYACAANPNNLTITDAYSLYITGAPIVGANMTLTRTWAAGFSGNIGVGAGTATLPSLSFLGKPNTGLWYGDTNAVFISCNGVTAYQFYPSIMYAPIYGSAATLSLRSDVSDAGSAKTAISGYPNAAFVNTASKLFALKNGVAGADLFYVDLVGTAFASNAVVGTYGSNTPLTFGFVDIYGAATTTKGQISAIDTTAFTTGVGGMISFGGNWNAGAVATTAGTIKAFKNTANSGEYRFDMLFCTREGSGSNPYPFMKLGWDGMLALTYATVPNTTPTDRLRIAPWEQPPATPLTAGTPTAGGAVTDGTHSYKFTFVTLEGETTPPAASVQINCGGGNNTVPLSAIATGSSRCTARKIYRTVTGDAGAYKLLATINDNTTTTYSDVTADAGLGADAPTYNSTTNKFVSTVVDGAAANAYVFDTTVNLTTAGANLLQLKNNGAVKDTFDKDGNFIFGQASGTSKVSSAAVAGVARTLAYDIPIIAGGAGAAAINHQIQIDGVAEAGLYAETDGGGTYRNAVWKVPYASADYGAAWVGVVLPNPAGLANGSMIVLHNTNGAGADRIYIYSGSAWKSSGDLI